MEIKKERIPPGQVVTAKFPVFKIGEVPQIDENEWEMKVFGEVEEERIINWKEFTAIPQTTVKADIHCVTKWSRLDNSWEGVLFRKFAQVIKIKESAKYLLAHSHDGYSMNLPVDVLMDDDVLLAVKHDGEYLSPEHGKPVRLVIPKRYGWKSAKWLSALEFLPEEKKGYWENNGYHNEGDPWKNQRFTWQQRD